ncbi:MAG: hypothetical protein ACK5NG_09155 [Chthoniobacterales bacterium]
MKKTLSTLLAGGFLLAASGVALAADNDTIEFSDDAITIETKDAEATEVEDDGKKVIKAKFFPTEKWSTVRILPASGSWDLSEYSGLEIDITNDGDEVAKTGARADQAGKASIKEQAWNSARVKTIAPGATETLSVIFGMDYGNPKEIDTANIGSILLFLGKHREAANDLTIQSIRGIKD